MVFNFILLLTAMIKRTNVLAVCTLACFNCVSLKIAIENKMKNCYPFYQERREHSEVGGGMQKEL